MRREDFPNQPEERFSAEWWRSRRYDEEEHKERRQAIINNPRHAHLIGDLQEEFAIQGDHANHTHTQEYHLSDDIDNQFEEYMLRLKQEEKINLFSDLFLSPLAKPSSPSLRINVINRIADGTGFIMSEEAAEDIEAWINSEILEELHNEALRDSECY